MEDVTTKYRWLCTYCRMLGLVLNDYGGSSDFTVLVVNPYTGAGKTINYQIMDSERITEELEALVPRDEYDDPID